MLGPLEGVRGWRLPISAPTSDGPQLSYIEYVGRVDRFSPYNDSWDVDAEWFECRGESLDGKTLKYLPSEKSVRVERVRIRDYDRSQPTIGEEDRNLLAEAGRWAYEHFSICEGNREWTFAEARAYVLADEAKNASPGYPWNQKHSSKQAVLECLECCAGIETWISKLGKSDVVSCFFALALKDEILKATKVTELKTRLFMCSPVEHHIAMLMFCGDMHERLMKDRGTWCSAGRMFQYGGWNAMMKALPFSWFVGLDAEMYDMSICRLLFSIVCQNVCQYCPARRAELEDLFAMALDAFIVTGRGDVLWKHGGNPSGWFLTLFLNTMVNYILVAYSWLRLRRTTREEFETMVRAWLCGDDSLLSIANSVKHEFTAKWISESMARVGVTIKQPYHESEALEDIEYCGAHSVKIEGVWCRKPRVVKFLDALGFTRDTAPQYRIQRAIAIYHEMWTVEEKHIVKSYIDWLVERYPHLAVIRQQQLMSNRRLRYLHLGLE